MFSMVSEWFQKSQACRRDDPDMVLARQRLRPDDAYAKLKSGEMSDDLLVDAGRVYWDFGMEKSALKSLHRQIPGIEHGTLSNRAYVRWQNGPDLYEFVDYAVSRVLVHALEFWTKIPQKLRGSAPRQNTDVAAIMDDLRESTDGDLRHNFCHAVDGFRDGEYFPFVRLFEQYPELAHDCTNYWTNRR